MTGGDVIIVGTRDFYNPNERIARSDGFDPRWVPLGMVGYTWGYFSYRGKLLGYVCKDGGRWWAIKTCCGSWRDYTTSQGAGRYVHSATYCTECKLSCLVSDLN